MTESLWNSPRFGLLFLPLLFLEVLSFTLITSYNRSRCDDWNKLGRKSSLPQSLWTETEVNYSKDQFSVIGLGRLDLFLLFRLTAPGLPYFHLPPPDPPPEYTGPQW